MVFLRIKSSDQTYQKRIGAKPQFVAYPFARILVRLESGQIKSVGHRHFFRCITACHMNLPRLLGTRKDA